MPIQAIAPVGAQAPAGVQSSLPTSGGATPGSSSVANEIDVRATSASEQHKPGVAENVASHVYDTIETLGVELPAVQNSTQATVSKAKQALSPDSNLIAAGPKPVVQGGNEALAALNKTFDHAVFMAMVNQVISGVGDTSRTLIRQT